MMDKGENTYESSKEDGSKNKGSKSFGCFRGCALDLIVWFLEHIDLDVLREVGHIPRHLNWDLRKTWKRSGFNSVLVVVPSTSVRDMALELKGSEIIVKDTGFLSSKYLPFLGNEHAL